MGAEKHRKGREEITGAWEILRSKRLRCDEIGSGCENARLGRVMLVAVMLTIVLDFRTRGS
jgi:hypothetical protein